MVDERLVKVLLDWWWNEEADTGNPGDYGTPIPEALDDIRTLLERLNRAGYRIEATP